MSEKIGFQITGLRVNNVTASYKIESCNLFQFSSVAQLCLTLQPRRTQHTRPPCPSPTPRAYPNSCPSSRWCHPTISSAVVPFSSCPQSFPALGGLFEWVSSSHQVAKVLEFQLQHQSFRWTLRTDLLFTNFCCSRVALRCCVASHCTAEWIVYLYTCVPLLLDFLPIQAPAECWVDRVPCALQQRLISHPFYTQQCGYVSPNLLTHPTLPSPGVHMLTHVILGYVNTERGSVLRVSLCTSAEEYWVSKSGAEFEALRL